VLIALFAVLADAGVTFAQNSCGQLESTLATLDRNRDYRNLTDNTAEARTAQRDVQRKESRYVSEGCNAAAKAGRPLSSQCRSFARDIKSGRADVEDLQRSVKTGNAVAQQREAVLQQIARFSCDNRSSVEVRRNRGNIFEQLFDVFSDSFDGGGGTRGEEFNPYGGYHTVRTMCVRKTDGFYWPISYSTLVDYVPNDLEACRTQCPTLDVDLYYYDNPGQEPDAMINLGGEPYKALPTAFKFRTEFDRAARCSAPVEYGSISLADVGDGRNRAMVSYGPEVFPLPIRDPRVAAPTVVAVAAVIDASATYVDIPLPRPRPAAPGETPPPVMVPVTAQQPLRIVQFGEKQVRIVGPDTPYIPTAAAGT